MESLKTDEHPDLPILIVCGAAHLFGGINQGSSSFLEYLYNTGQFNEFKVMNAKGKWVPLSPVRNDK